VTQTKTWYKIKATGTKFVSVRTQSVTKWNQNPTVSWNEDWIGFARLKMSTKKHAEVVIVSTKCSTGNESWQTWTQLNVDDDKFGNHGLQCCQWHWLMFFSWLHKKKSSSLAESSICSNLFRFEFSVCCHFLHLCSMCMHVYVLGLCL